MWPPQKVPKGAGELIMYLDFDGVLHHENCLWLPKRGPYLKAPPGYSLFQHAPLLEKLLVPYPQILIVLSTSWVRSYGCTGAAKRLPQSLQQRVIGATFHSRMNKTEFIAAPRGMQVWGDVVRRKPKDWIALDDDWLHWPKWCLDKYVKTHEFAGISDPAVMVEISEKLAVMCRADQSSSLVEASIKSLEAKLKTVIG
ncbi:MAG: HAD domain-containing protein [Rhodoferax sp.]|uniref:HAD domain-containing protein n=1 Tax=Rhodoferax sp. TaxID=50421 RepID=UPI00261D5780|nr:HAD domain-containing protein [Rhodoferax sp.]MDD2881093.1 HAD domain-containing protein [Rhodoferax sp.]